MTAVRMHSVGDLNLDLNVTTDRFSARATQYLRGFMYFLYGPNNIHGFA